MKTIGVTIAALVFSISTSFAQIKQERKVSSFSKLKSTSAIKVILTIGDKESVTFEAEEAVLPKLKAEVKGGELKLYTDGNVNTKKQMVAYVTAKSISSLDAESASSIEVTNAVNADVMNLVASSAGSIKLELNAKQVIANVDGAGSIKVKGATSSLKANASGAGSLKALELKSEKVVVTASGAGSANVNAIQSLDATANSAGSVTYIGEPKEKKINNSISGNIKKS